MGKGQTTNAYSGKKCDAQTSIYDQECFNFVHGDRGVNYKDTRHMCWPLDGCDRPFVVRSQRSTNRASL